MPKTGWILFIIAVTGLFILLLPDDGVPVVRFNQMHGPSKLDLAGLSLILVSWLASCIQIIRSWNEIRTRIGHRNIIVLVTSYLLSGAGIVLSLVLSAEWVLWSCVGVAMLVNILFVVYAFRTAR